MDKHQELYDLKKDLWDNLHLYSEEQYIDKIQYILDFIYKNFQEEDTLNGEYYSHKFEIEMSKIAGNFYWVMDGKNMDARLRPDYKHLTTSVKIKQYLIEIATREQYANARPDFMNKIADIWENDYIELMKNEDLWGSLLLKETNIELLNRKHIGGFEEKIQNIIENEPNQKSNLAKLAKRYLKNCPKFKKNTTLQV